MPRLPIETNLDAIREQVRVWQRDGRRVGVVPTMGALHEGHLSLVSAAAEECQQVVTTVFVNPTQFGPGEDFDKYPRDLERDVDLLATAGCDVVFAPATDDMYSPGSTTSVDVGRVAEPWEGANRPIHFRGVATVVLKLLNIVPADIAYFGQKDYQQTVVVQQMVRDLNVPTRIRVCPTVREANGLAMSSRNNYLTPEERSNAALLSRSLYDAQRQIEQGGTSSQRVVDQIQRDLADGPFDEVDYVAVLADGTVDPVEVITGPVVIAVAARIGKTRLIDNVRIGKDKEAGGAANEGSGD